MAPELPELVAQWLEAPQAPGSEPLRHSRHLGGGQLPLRNHVLVLMHRAGYGKARAGGELATGADAHARHLHELPHWRDG